VKPRRRDCPRRVTPALLDFYIARGHALRAAAWRDTVWAIWALLKRLWR
jgi:hypothetical protein